MPKISIVTPSFNQAPFLEQTIRSVLDEQACEVEYFIVDGGSTDGSLEIIQRWASRLAWWVSEPDNGQPHAINKGLGRVSGEIVGYINSDDWYHPGALDAVVQWFEQHPEEDWLAGVVDNYAGEICTKRVVPACFSVSEFLGRYRYNFPQPGVFWRRRMQEKIGVFDDSLHYCFDHEYWVRALAAGYRPVCTDLPIACFRLHAASKTTSQHHRFIVEDRQIAQRYRSLLSAAEYRQVKQWLRAYEADYFIDDVYLLLEGSGRLPAAAYLLRGLALLPFLTPKRLYVGAWVRTLFSGRPPAWFFQGK